MTESASAMKSARIAATRTVHALAPNVRMNAVLDAMKTVRAEKSHVPHPASMDATMTMSACPPPARLNAEMGAIPMAPALQCTK